MSWGNDHDDFWMDTPQKSQSKGFESWARGGQNDGLGSLFDPFNPYFNYNSQLDDVDEDW